MKVAKEELNELILQITDKYNKWGKLLTINGNFDKFLSILTIAQASFIALLGAEVIPIDSNLRKALIILLGLLTAAFQLLGTFLPVRKRVIRRADSYFEVMGKAYVLRRKLQNLQAQVETEVAEKLPGIRDEFYALCLEADFIEDSSKL